MVSLVCPALIQSTAKPASTAPSPLPVLSSSETVVDVPVSSPPKGSRFWLIIVALTISVFLAAFEMSAVATSLPAIVNDLHGSDFVWVGTAYPLASTAFLPMSGGLAEIFGRRPALLLAIMLFALGSALCGSARNMNWLIGARTVQGLGGGGILSLSSIVVSDLVSLQERGTYNGIVGLAWAFSIAIGPLAGGALASEGQWRWIFYLNLPICGVAIAMVFLFLRLPTPKGTLKEKLCRMDWLGNLLVISSTTSLVIGLTWGGVSYPWSSGRVLAPLVLGSCGFVAFLVFEARYAQNPILPFSLLSNRSSVSGYIQTFINALVTLSAAYYLPVYWQACKDASVVRSGVNMLGLSITMGPIIVVSGASVAVSKRYRPQIWIAWALFLVGTGAFSTMRSSTPLSQSIGLPVLMSAGAGILAATTYFPVLSPLPVSQNAHALAFFFFFRSFAGIWGVTIGATVLQNELGRRLPASFLSELHGGGSGFSLAYSIIPEIRFFGDTVKEEVHNAFADSLAVVWVVLTGILGIGAVASVFMEDIPLQNVTDKKWSTTANTDSKEPVLGRTC